MKPRGVGDGQYGRDAKHCLGGRNFTSFQSSALSCRAKGANRWQTIERVCTSAEAAWSINCDARPGPIRRAQVRTESL